MSENESSMFRCPHDEQNPYAQISRAMLHDKELSLKAKGLLSYLISLPPGWKYYHSQLMSALNCGEKCLNSGIDELIKAGYAQRGERIKSKSGTYTPYAYKFSELKKFLPDRLSQPALSSLQKDDLVKKEEKKKEEVNINPPPPTTPKISQSSEEEDSFIFDILKDKDLSDKDKIRLSKKYNEFQIGNALVIAKTQPIKKSLMSLLINILDNPENWNDKIKINPLTTKQQLALSYNQELSKINQTIYKENETLINMNCVKVFLNNSLMQISLNAHEFEQEIQMALNQLKKEIYV